MAENGRELMDETTVNYYVFVLALLENQLLDAKAVKAEWEARKMLLSGELDEIKLRSMPDGDAYRAIEKAMDSLKAEISSVRSQKDNLRLDCRRLKHELRSNGWTPSEIDGMLAAYDYCDDDDLIGDAESEDVE